MAIERSLQRDKVKCIRDLASFLFHACLSVFTSRVFLIEPGFVPPCRKNIFFPICEAFELHCLDVIRNKQYKGNITYYCIVNICVLDYRNRYYQSSRGFPMMAVNPGEEESVA